MASSVPASSRSLSETGHKRLCSFPSRQRRMGPAPLASFEDLSMDKTTSDSSPEDHRVPLPEIDEETSPPASKGALSVPTSPQIRVSAASSPSQQGSDSKESTPDKEIFTGYTKSEFCEEMSDLKASTDELDAEDQERARKRQVITQQLADVEKREESLKIRELMRKGSSSSVLSDGLLPITSEHSSRLSSLGSIGSPVRRSPSPHKMLLETSFCGNKPIQHPSIDIEDPPVSAALLNYAMDNLESIKSPTEAKSPHIFHTMSPIHDTSQLKGIKGSSTIPRETPSKSLVKQQELTKSLQRRQEQQRRQAEHQEYYQRHIEQTDQERKTVTLHPSSDSRYEDSLISAESLSPSEVVVRGAERQSRNEKRQIGPNSKSPRLAKKVPVPQVPDLKDLPRTSPSSPAASGSMAISEFHNARSSKSITPSGSPKSTKKLHGKKGRETESDESTASVSRKSSFASIFKKSDAAMSPGTPDSPGYSGGRKSPFAQFIKSAENKFRSRSRSRSRSKSRDRDLDDDTHDRRKVLSIFMPSKKKKQENDKAEVKESQEKKLNDPMANVEFKFNSESTYQSSSYGLIRQESEVTRAIHEPVTAEKKEKIETGHETVVNGKDDSFAEFSEIMSETNRTGSITENFSEEVTSSLKEREERLKEQKQNEEINGSIKPENREVYDLKISEKATLSPKLKDKTHGINLDISNEQDQDSLSISESERGSEIDYYKKKEKLAAAADVESPDTENKGLVSQESLEDEELPYVPTTLPQERSVAVPMLPAKERAPKLKMTQSIDRPRSATPRHPSRLEEYQQSSQDLLDQDSEKMTISIKVPPPGAVKVLPSKGPKRQDSKTWEDFCSEGLKTSKQLRKQLQESQQSSGDSSLPSQTATKENIEPAGEPPSSMTPRKWINFDEMPSIVLKPVRQIKTVPHKRHPLSAKQEIADVEFLERARIIRAKEENQKATSPKEEQRLEYSDKESSEHSSEESEDEKATSVSSSEELNTVRSTLEELKKQSAEEDSYENSDLERLLAPVNECITKMSSELASSGESQMVESRKSPIPDNWEDFLLPPQPGRRSRLSSLGSDAGSVGGRSPSPSALLFETSFCGSQPIDDPGLAEPDVPIPIARKLSGISLGDLSPVTSRGDRGGSLHSGHFLSQPDRTSIMSDSSAEGGSPRGSDYDPSEIQRVFEGNTSHLNPFGMDLEVKSNRSSIVSQDQSPTESPFHAARHPS